ncbi:hypothetical protein SNOUR_05610 [Streptomyces noursei ATCC 11455]|uniref:hypothetical protein n=1 Tax=Streptomyces noursei TaxID=1971 RepID=UPI00081D1B67|nr:hypothetical protein SNOUR_05610 [Streptomyces noursei ATCC 11455]
MTEHTHHRVAAHDQMLTLHLSQHVEERAPREDDSHYHLFEQAKARLKKQGLWRCIVNDELCGGGPELHHSHVEFSEIASTDPAKVEKALGLHFEDDEARHPSPGALRASQRTR